MNDYQVVEVKMIQESVNFFDLNPDLEKTNTILKGHVGLVRINLKEIERNKIIQEFVNTGYTENKKDAKMALANLCVNITSSICSFADDTGKKELYNEFKTPISRVNKMSDANIITYSNTAYKSAKKYKTELKPYNVTAEEITNLKNLSEEYSKILLIPGKERDDRAVATSNIKKLIPETLKIFTRKIDRDMMHYKDTEPDIYKGYEKAREIDDSQTTAISIKGTVVDADGNEPLPHVKCTAKFKAGSELAEYHTKTTAKANYQFKGIPDGKCKLIFELEYYDKLVVDTAVYGGEFTRVDVELVKTSL